METKRQRQVAEMVKRNFGFILQQEGSYIYGTAALVTVTEVKMSPDLMVAKIYLSVYNIEDKQVPVLLLREETVRLRQALGARIRKHVRVIPDIFFHLDDTLDEMYRIQTIFDKLHEDNQMGSEEEEEESEEEEAEN